MLHSSGVFSTVISLPKDNNPASTLSIMFGDPGLMFSDLPASKIVSHRDEPSSGRDR